MSSTRWSPRRFFLTAGCLLGLSLFAGIVGTMLVVGSYSAKNNPAENEGAPEQSEKSDDGAAPASDGQPSEALFKQVLSASLQKLKPTSATERTVLFQGVRAGTRDGDSYPFEVTATIHDYDPGYPSNRYYGQTCVGQMDNWKFVMSKDEFGDWIVQGRMTVSDSQCRNNPSQGESAFPLSGLSGELAQPGTPAAAKPAPRQETRPGSLPLGEYACYGVGSRLMAGMGFKLESSGSYTDVDGERGGTWVHDAAAATISFSGGFLDGQTGRDVRSTGFQISPTVSCEPWH
jgi:hypothetical protein